MAAIGKILRTPTEEYIRELFKKGLGADDKILWQGGGYYYRSFDNKINYRLLLIVIRTVLSLLAVFAVINELLTSDDIKAGIIIAAFSILFVLIYADELLGVYYPRYFVVTDKGVGLCRRSFFGQNSLVFIPYKLLRDVEIKSEFGDRMVILDTYDSDDKAFYICGLDFVESERAYEKIKTSLDAYNKANRPQNKESVH